MDFEESLEEYVERQVDFHKSFVDAFYYEKYEIRDSEVFKLLLEAAIFEAFSVLVKSGIEIESGADRYSLLLAKQYIKSSLLINELVKRRIFFDTYVLVRKQLESSVRLRELNEKEIKRLQNKTPNMGNVFPDIFKEIKKMLSEHAHVSSLDRIERFNSFDLVLDEEYEEKNVDEINLILGLGHVGALASLLVVLQKKSLQEVSESLDKKMIEALKYAIQKKLIMIS